MNLILILLLAVQSGSARIHGIKLQKEISIDGQVAVGQVLRDKDGSPHILITTLSSVRSYNLEGKLEWVFPKARYFADKKSEYPKMETDFTMLYYPINDSLGTVYIVNLKSGKVTDSTIIHKFLTQPTVCGIANKYFIVLTRRNRPLDNPKMRFFKINNRGKITLSSVLSGGFYPEGPFLWENETALLGMWATINGEAPARAGITDSHVGLAMVSLPTGTLINRFIIPFGVYARSYILLKPPDTIFLLYRGNYRNNPSYSGIYKLKLPDLSEISHIEIIGNIFFSQQIINGRYIAGVNEKDGNLYLINTKNLEVEKVIDLKNFAIPLIPANPHIKSRRMSRLGVMDINDDKIDDIVVIYAINISHKDPMWNLLTDSRGMLIEFFYVLVIPGPDYSHVYPIFLGQIPVKGADFVPSNKLLVIYRNEPESKIEIYKLF